MAPAAMAATPAARAMKASGARTGRGTTTGQRAALSSTFARGGATLALGPVRRRASAPGARRIWAAAGRNPAAAAAATVTVEPPEVETPVENKALPYLEDRREEGFNWVKNWYPVSFLEYMDDEYPYPFELLGYNLVFWKDAEGTWRCVHDSCPHRKVPLSEGRVNEAGEIECGYHGWTFDGDGKCTGIPQGEGGTQGLGPGACATALPTRVEQGMLFVWADPASADEADESPLPLIEEIDDPDWVVINMQRDLPFNASTLLENTLDVSHVPWTHHGTMSKRSTSCTVDLEILDTMTHGFTGRWQGGPRSGALGPQSTQYHAPSMMRHRVDYRKGGMSAMTVTYATPLAPGRCRLMARFPFKFPNKLIKFVFTNMPMQWTQHIGQNTILEDDQVFLHWQERFCEREEMASGNGLLNQYYCPTPADAFVLSYLKWMKEEAGGGPTWAPGVDATLPPGELVKEKLLDRYESHTKHCPTCSGALKGVRRVRWALVAAGAACAVAAATLMGGALAMQLQSTMQMQVMGGEAASTWSLVKPVLRVGAVWLAATVAAALAWFRLGKTEHNLVQGPYPPPRIQKKFTKGKYAM